MGKHAVPKKRDAKNPDGSDNTTTPLIRPIVPILALALTGLASLGAGVTATSQAADQQHRASVSTTATSQHAWSPRQADLPDRVSRAAARTEIPNLKNGVLKPQPSPTHHDNSDVLATGQCEASYYDTGTTTASGEPFDTGELTAANKSLPFGTRVRVTNVANGKSVVVRINDRGPYVSGRCLDLTPTAFDQIAGTGAGTAEVRYEAFGA